MPREEAEPVVGAAEVVVAPGFREMYLFTCRAAEVFGVSGGERG